MNAHERTDGEFAHRGQRVRMPIPEGLTLTPGERVHITFDAPYAWPMPAVVIDVDGAMATIEPGAAVKEPGRWYLVAPTRAPAADPEPQLALFGDC